MAKLRLAIAAAVLAAMSVLATAQGPSYESRGYGGPLSVGPNFQGGGQNSAPIYEPKSSRKHYRKRRYRAKSHKKRAVKQTETAKSSPEKSGVINENSSISRASDDAEEKAEPKRDDTAAVETENSSISAAELGTGATNEEAAPKAQKAVGCKKYFPTAGMTLSVPCN